MGFSLFDLFAGLYNYGVGIPRWIGMAFWARQKKGGSLAVPVLVAAGLALSAGAFVQMRHASREVEGVQLERQAIQLS